MSSLTPYSDARTLLLTANLLPATRVHFANEPFTEPNPPDLWLSVDAYSPDLNMLDIGANMYREQGIIRILCIAPAGSGTDGLRQLAKDVTTVFRGLGPRNPYYLNAAIGEGLPSDDGLWFSLPVTVEFRYEDTT